METMRRYEVWWRQGRAAIQPHFWTVTGLDCLYFPIRLIYVSCVHLHLSFFLFFFNTLAVFIVFVMGFRQASLIQQPPAVVCSAKS